MPMFDQNHVKVCGAIVLWDGMTKPDTNESGTKHHFKLAVPPNHPDIVLLEQLAQRKLSEGTFKGVLPNNGTMPVGTLAPNEYDGKFPGWRVFTAGTYRGVPDIYDENGSPQDIMQVGSMIYPGQYVDVLVHCYENNGKVKGIACGLDGFSILASKQAPRQNFNGGPGVNTAGAFGGAPAAASPQAAAPAPTSAAAGGATPPPPTASAPAAGRDPVEMLGGADYAAHIAAGWTDQTLIEHGKARAWPAETPAAPAPAGVAPPPAAAAPAPAAAPRDPVQMLNGADYAAHIAAGWTDETLIAHGKATAWPDAGAAPTQATGYLPGQ